MRKVRAVILFAVFLPVAGAEAPAPGDPLEASIRDAAPLASGHSISAYLTYPDPDSTLGEGHFDLTARPESNEIEVQLIVGAAVRDARWERCEQLGLRLDGRFERLAARRAEIELSEGVYEALSARLSIALIRDMSRADTVGGELCGHGFQLGEEGRALLDDFVRQFDERATYDGPPPPSPPPRLLPEPGAPFPIEGAEETPHPA